MVSIREKQRRPFVWPELAEEEKQRQSVTYTKACPLYIDPKVRLYRCKGAPLVVRNQVERRNKVNKGSSL